LVGQAYDGSVASARVPVRGVFRTKIDDLDGYVAVMPMAVMRDFLAAPSAVTAVAVRLRDRGALAAAIESLSAASVPTTRWWAGRCCCRWSRSAHDSTK
jgi:putative ABC transport system permease protein